MDSLVVIFLLQGSSISKLHLPFLGWIEQLPGSFDTKFASEKVFNAFLQPASTDLAFFGFTREFGSYVVDYVHGLPEGLCYHAFMFSKLCK